MAGVSVGSRIGGKDVQQGFFFPTCLAHSSTHSISRSSRCRTLPGQSPPRGNNQHGAIEGMSALPIHPFRDERSSRFGIRKGENWLPASEIPAAPGPDPASTPSGQSDAAATATAHRSIRCGPGWRQMGRDQDQLGQQPPLAAAVVKPSIPAQPPAREGLFPVRHGNVSSRASRSHQWDHAAILTYTPACEPQ